MSKNFKKALAFGSAVALGAAGLIGVSAPAYAAGEVTIAPTSGSKYAVFSTDEFSLTTTVVTQAVSASTLSYALTDADQGKWYVKVGNITSSTGATADSNMTFAARNALGANIDMDTTADAQATIAIAAVSDGTTDNFSQAETERHGEFLIDFAALDATTVYISGIAAAAGTNVLSVSPYEGSITATGNAPTGSIQSLSGNDVVGNSDELDFGDLDAELTVQAWVDLDSDIDDIESNYASAAQAISWFDPKSTSVIPAIERFVSAANTVYLNDTTSSGDIAATIQFTKAVNLDQIDITKWNMKVANSDGTAVTAETAIASNELLKAAGYTTHDAAGKLHAFFNDNVTLDITKDYVLSVESGGTGGVYFGSVAFVPASNTTDDANYIQATVTDSTNAIQTDATDESIQLRAGTKAFTYRAQIKSADTTAKAASSVLVAAVVQAGSYFSTGGSLTVSGANKPLTRVGEAVIVTGFTDADGRYSVTVTSANADADEDYTVDFYVLDGSTDAFVNARTSGDSTAKYTAAFESATATTLTPESSVVSGATVVASFTVTDQFGVATNKRGTRDVSVELKSSNGTSLDKDAVVAANGTVSFSFPNYVVAGASDVLTATTYTGTATNPTNLSGALVKTIQLYNPGAASAVQIPATLTGVVTYDDFITGKATTAAPAPNDGTMTLTGTVVDANGSGVPAAVVTLEAAGFQFQNSGSTTYAQDKITVSASASGVFTVNVWAHKATGATGTPLKVTTSDGKTATTTVKTYLPASGVDGNNLKFELIMPANVVKNTTYAVTAKLTDKWGNPIATSGNTSAVSIQGVGSVQINSVDTATSKQFGKDGTTVVFLRSVKDIAGPGSVTATLAAANYSATSAATATALSVAEIATDVTTTAWNETLFTNSISANVEVLESAAGIAKVNVGSFNGKLVVYANGYNGKRISWKVGGRWGSAVASSNTARFDRPTPRRGVTVTVEIYVDGKLELTKSVLTR